MRAPLSLHPQRDVLAVSAPPLPCRCTRACDDGRAKLGVDGQLILCFLRDRSEAEAMAATPAWCETGRERAP